MSTISTQLRNFKEPTKEQLTQLFFALPPPLDPLEGEKSDVDQLEKMEISAVLVLQDEQSWVSAGVLARGDVSPHSTQLSCVTV